MTFLVSIPFLVSVLVLGSILVWFLVLISVSAKSAHDKRKENDDE